VRLVLRPSKPAPDSIRGHRRKKDYVIFVGAFPGGKSCLSLAAARLRHITGTTWSTKRYLNMELLQKGKIAATITA
jgi:hypothetical protein